MNACLLQPGEPVLVLGAGLMGRLLACTLAARGHPVQVYEAQGADGQGAAARVAAAMLAPLAESAITEPPVVAMGAYSVPRWPQLIAELEQPVFFQQNGTLVLWHRQDQQEQVRFSQLLARTCTTVPGLPSPQTVHGAELAALEPAVAGRFAQGLYLPQEGQLDNRQLLAALLQRMQTLGVKVHWHTPKPLAEALALQAQQGGWLLDCRGLGAQHEWQAKPDRTPQVLRGVRGEVARIHAPDVTLQRPTRLLHPRYPIYIAPKPDHVFVIGATEIESDDMSPISVRSTLELLSAAYAVHPGFGEARILELTSQCRPTLPDNLPALAQLGPKALQINGLYRHGFMISPAVHDAVLDWMTHGHTHVAQQLQLRFDTSALV
jgi:glycine oxidase